MDEIITDAITSNQDETSASVSSSLALDGKAAQAIINATATAINSAVIDTQPVILCSSLIRRHFRRLTEQFLPNIVVLAYNEVPPNIEVQQVGIVTLQLSAAGVQGV